MTGEQPRVIELIEYAPRTLARAELAAEAGEILWRHYSPQVAVEFPSPRSEGGWRLTALGWVGYIPLGSQLGVALRPKIPLANLFGMLENAYQLKSFHILPGLVACQSLEAFYERLAHLLARRVLERSRKGLHRAFTPQTARLPYVRGRLDGRSAWQTPAQVRLTCHYRDGTVDIEDNQILGWTLWRVARSGLATERALPTIRQAYRALQRSVTLVPYPPEACANRPYNRLNEDYQPLHALCRFFLEHTGPGHQAGDRTMTPFLVNMARLYERFVAEWLDLHLPPGFVLEPQAQVYLSLTNDLRFEIDLVVYGADQPDAARWVLDTKYKASAAPTSEDVAQVVAYAQATGCREAILIYPAPLARPLDAYVGDIRVRGLTFSLEYDLETAGQQFLQDLFS